MVDMLGELDLMVTKGELISPTAMNEIMLSIKSWTNQIWSKTSSDTFGVNQMMQFHALPYVITYIVSKDVSLLTEGKVTYGFKIIEDITNCSNNPNQAQYNIHTLLKGLCTPDPKIITKLEMLTVQRVLTNLYDWAFGKFKTHERGDAYRIEDLNLLLYNARIPYRIYPLTNGYMIEEVNWKLKVRNDEK